MENVKWDKVDKIDIFIFLKIIFYKPKSSDVAAAERILIASDTNSQFGMGVCQLIE